MTKCLPLGSNQSRDRVMSRVSGPVFVRSTSQGDVVAWMELGKCVHAPVLNLRKVYYNEDLLICYYVDF